MNKTDLRWATLAAAIIESGRKECDIYFLTSDWYHFLRDMVSDIISLENDKHNSSLRMHQRKGAGRVISSYEYD